MKHYNLHRRNKNCNSFKRHKNLKIRKFCLSVFLLQKYNAKFFIQEFAKCNLRRYIKQ